MCIRDSRYQGLLLLCCPVPVERCYIRHLDSSRDSHLRRVRRFHFYYIGKYQVQSTKLNPCFQACKSCQVDRKVHKVLCSVYLYYRPLSALEDKEWLCLLYTSPSPRDRTRSRM